jgi:GNAT superfamily N-acetyltransferase
MDFHPVEANLRDSFRALASGRPRADLLEASGVTIASLGARFQMFNAAFLSSPVATSKELEQRLGFARTHFRSRNLPWALWVCEDWVETSVRRGLSQLCATHGLRLTAEMPGMIAAGPIAKPRHALPAPEYRRVNSLQTLADFRGIGSVCFHVPPEWFNEVFDESVPCARPGFECWVAYFDGAPVATAASVPSDGVIGLYNIATAPEYRGRGFGEAITRHLIGTARAGQPACPIVLQSTSHGFRLYQRLGFKTTTRFVVYNSVR